MKISNTIPMDDNKKGLIDVKLNASEALKKLDKTTDEGRHEYEAYGFFLFVEQNVGKTFTGTY